MKILELPTYINVVKGYGEHYEITKRKNVQVNSISEQIKVINKFELVKLTQLPTKVEKYTVVLVNKVTGHKVNLILSYVNLVQLYSDSLKDKTLIKEVSILLTEKENVLIPTKELQKYVDMYKTEQSKTSKLNKEQEIKVNSLAILNNVYFNKNLEDSIDIVIYQYKGYDIFPYLNDMLELRSLSKRTHGFKIFTIISIPSEQFLEILENEYNITQNILENEMENILPISTLSKISKDVFKGKLNEYLSKSNLDSYFFDVTKNKRPNNYYSPKYFTNKNFTDMLVDNEIAVIGESSTGNTMISYNVIKEDYEKLCSLYKQEYPITDEMKCRSKIRQTINTKYPHLRYFLFYQDFIETMLKELYDEGYKDKLKESVRMFASAVT